MRLASLAAALLILTAGCAVPEPATTVAPQKSGQPQQKKAAPKKAAAGVGDPVKDGKLTFTITKTADGPAKLGNDFLSKEPQGRFFFVYVTVTNHGDRSQIFVGDAQKLKAGKTEYSADSEAAIYLKDTKSLFTEVNPGNTVKGIIVYDIPKGVKPTSIELHDSPFSGGVTVKL